MQQQLNAARNGTNHVVEDAVSAVLSSAAVERRPNPHAIGFVRSNSYALSTRDTTYAVPDFFPVGGVAWPETLLELWKSMRYGSLTGVFADLSRAWFTVDNRLVIWDYRGGREFCVYDEISEMISVVGSPLRPLSGIFQPHVTYIIPVGTTSMMFLLGLCILGEGALAEMKVVNLGYSCSTDTVITKAIGSSGRVFCAGADGNVYELRYMRENTPITPKIRMVNYGYWFSSAPILGQVTLAVANVWQSWRGSGHGGLIDLVVDERDGILATLCERSTISLWRLNPSGGIRYMFSLRHRPDRLPRSHSAPHVESAPLTRLFVIEADAQGCRLMSTALNGDQFRYRYINAFDSVFSGELILQSHTPSYLSANKEISVCYASASVFLAAFSDMNDDRASDEVLAATSPATVMAPHQNVRDIVASFSGPSSRIVRVDAIDRMPTQGPQNLSDLCAQVCSPRPTYVVVHRHGLSLFAQARPVDTLYLILSTNDADYRDSLLSRFTSVYSAPDYAAMLLQVAVGGLNVTTEHPLPFTKDSALSSSHDDGAALNELGQQLVNGRNAEVLRRARELLRNLQLPATQAAPASGVTDAEVQHVVVLMSPFATGLVAFVARALCLLWNTGVGKITQSSATSAVRVLEKVIQYLDSLSIGRSPEHQRTVSFQHEWQADKVVVMVPRGRSLRAEDVKKLQGAMLYKCYELTHKAWQAATLLQRMLGIPFYSEDASVAFAQVVRDSAVAQRLGHYLSQVMLDSQYGISAGSGLQAASFAQLQRQCPYFFGGISSDAYQLQSDMRSLTRGESLQSYTEAQMHKWATEVGAKAATYWPSGALQSICEQLRSLKYENVAVELLLHAAAQLDPNNAALSVFLADGGGHVGDQARYGNAYSLHQTKTQVLELVVSTLESAWLTHRSVVDDLLGGPRRSGTIWQVEPSDEYAHCFLFDWMCAPRDDRNTAKLLRETLVAARSQFLGSYLRRNAEVLTEEYAHYLASVQGDYHGAMQQCFVMALSPLPDTPVADRLQYRLRCLREALDCAKKCQSDQTQQVEQQLRLMEAQERLYRIATEFISSGSATLDRRVEWEGEMVTERDVALQHIEFLSSFVASASDLIEVGGMYPALGGAEVQLDALLCSNVTDAGVYATCIGRAYDNEKDSAETITKRLIDRYFHQISCFPLSYLVRLLEARTFLRFPAGSTEVVQLLVSLGVDPKVLFITYESVLEGRDDTGVGCVEFDEAGVTRGYLVYAYATVLVYLADLGRRGSVQQWLVSNAMAATRSMIRRAAGAVTSPSEQAAVEQAEELLRKANTLASSGVWL
ncbi:putative nuclear pore complex protein (NUP155) [Leishmania infantum JPCM5]|uniref:Nuclear_pore_complex_protein_(NUP155)_-_putative n=2 Tax=Leishmania infantum TaxID=5671 RepID=A0A6L0XTJ1_LEIIN|nr:putative nuclear pore complex protein (NUP155) [Leishmania infantum JPCM5]CAC9553533.1 nuclear_pore_complex_protein_(NUP155)_-_putative [Leishmania infantum]CAM72506.1 putative nuclear pore complex protein (NUP155) [Leishmania infantum JPCM5]SUZ47113.1 nuclear_pore_complex_protein_(NUP155)_-_putative [Leishmania infantum]|eukprot:XP_001469399.1 putative nuclear pore complex protein (NUP155) [Leishmania infantum JPCM5]